MKHRLVWSRVDFRSDRIVLGKYHPSTRRSHACDHPYRSRTPQRARIGVRVRVMFRVGVRLGLVRRVS